METKMEIIWMCPACGKWNKDRKKVGDITCYIAAMKVYKELCVFGNNGRIMAVKEGGLVKRK
jgi:hypothetical protein